MESTEKASAGKGFPPAITAFVIWGGFPLYFHLLHQVSAFQVIAHRIAWSCAFVIPWIALRKELPQLRAALTNRTVVLRLVASATLITINWVAYVWAVINSR